MKITTIRHIMATVVAMASLVSVTNVQANSTFVIDPTQSFLQVIGSLQSPENGNTAGPLTNLIDYYSGTISGTETTPGLPGNVLSFVGGSYMTAGFNPTGPFIPLATGTPTSGNGSVDNYAGNSQPASPVIIAAALRDLILDPITGSVTNGSPTAGMKVASIQGRIGYNTLLGNGSGSLVNLAGDASGSGTNVQLFTIGTTEFLVLPIQTLHVDPATGLAIGFVGQIVASQNLVPEPASIGMAGFGLTALAFVAYRRRRSA